MPKVLLVEDDEDLADMVSSWLVNERYTVEVAHDGNTAGDLLRLASFDVIVLDWDLPGRTGIEVLRQFRADGGMNPVIMLTGKSDFADKEAGLEGGADDYLTKPFSVRELGARVRALLRRPAIYNTAVLKAGNIELDASKHLVLVGGEEVHLQPKDFSLLEFLLRHKGEVFSGESLIARVWASDSDASPEGLRTSIKRIRKKIDAGEEESKSMIETIAKVGYRMRAG